MRLKVSKQKHKKTHQKGNMKSLKFIVPIGTGRMGRLMKEGQRVGANGLNRHNQKRHKNLGKSNKASEKIAHL